MGFKPIGFDAGDDRVDLLLGGFHVHNDHHKTTSTRTQSEIFAGLPARAEEVPDWLRRCSRGCLVCCPPYTNLPGGRRWRVGQVRAETCRGPQIYMLDSALGPGGSPMQQDAE